MKYALNLNAENRILSAWKIFHGMSCGNMIVVDTLPDGKVTDYLYVDGEYIYDPLPEPEQPDPTPADSERITALEDTITALIGGISDAV